jgi:hypothetical protein
LVSDAFDSGQANEAKLANFRLSRKRRNTLKKHLASGRRLAKRIVRHQEAIDGQNGAIQATLQSVGQVLNFSRSLQVEGDKSLQIVLKSDSPAGDFPVGKLWMLFLVLVGLGLVRAVVPNNA